VIISKNIENIIRKKDWQRKWEEEKSREEILT
jgi:hypothetical protein